MVKLAVGYPYQILLTFCFYIPDSSEKDSVVLYFCISSVIFAEAKVYDLVVIIMTMFPALVVPKVPDYLVNPKKIVSLLLGR